MSAIVQASVIHVCGHDATYAFPDEVVAKREIQRYSEELCNDCADKRETLKSTTAATASGGNGVYFNAKHTLRIDW